MPTPDKEAEEKTAKLTVELDNDDIGRIIRALITIPEFVPAAEIEPLLGATVDDLWRIADDLGAQSGRNFPPRGTTPEEWLKSLE